MTYLVKYTDLTKDFPKPDVIDRWEFVEKICEGNSLRDINKYLLQLRQLEIEKEKVELIKDNKNISIIFGNASPVLPIK